MSGLLAIAGCVLVFAGIYLFALLFRAVYALEKIAADTGRLERYLGDREAILARERAAVEALEERADR